MGYAEKMQKLCVLQGLDQSALAEQVGLSRSSISRILSGAQEPKLGLAFLLARALGVSLDYLADDDVPIDAPAQAVPLTVDELTILKLVRRLGTDVAMDRLLGVSSNSTAGQPDVSD
jgi:transcriptional regulator with XRE-family HTH domain